MTTVPLFTSEDFAFMLRERAGANLWLGRRRKPGQQDAPSHHPAYDFNDEALAFGHSGFVAGAISLAAGVKSTRLPQL